MSKCQKCKDLVGQYCFPPVCMALIMSVENNIHFRAGESFNERFILRITCPDQSCAMRPGTFIKKESIVFPVFHFLTTLFYVFILQFTHLFWTNYDWGPQIDYFLFKSLLIQDGQTFQCKSYWHAPYAGLVRNSYLNKNFNAAGRSGNEISVLESEEWVSWSKGYILSESGTFKTLFKWDIQKKMNLTSPLSRWSQLREKHEPVVCVCWNVLLLLTQNPLDP